MLKTRTRVFLPDNTILEEKKGIDVNCFIDLNHVVAFYEMPIDDEYPEGGTNVCVGGHDITILMDYNTFELIFENFLKSKNLFGVKFN